MKICMARGCISYPGFVAVTLSCFASPIQTSPLGSRRQPRSADSRRATPSSRDIEHHILYTSRSCPRTLFSRAPILRWSYWRSHWRVPPLCLPPISLTRLAVCLAYFIRAVGWLTIQTSQDNECPVKPSVQARWRSSATRARSPCAGPHLQGR